MVINMKNKSMFTIIFGLSFFMATMQAQAAGTGFSYQGELIDNGSPANGNYDIAINYFDFEAGGSPHLLPPPEFLSINVINGLFTLEDVDFGDIYSGRELFWLEIYVRESTSGGAGLWTTLAPRHKLNATPYSSHSFYADYAAEAAGLTINGASTGDVLTYNGTDWVPAAATGTSPWIVNGSGILGENISYNTGVVGIGTNQPTANLSVIHGGGVFSQPALDITIAGNKKFEVNTNGGTSVGSAEVPPTNGLKVFGNAQIGENISTTDATLDINSIGPGVQDDPLRVRKNGLIKFYVDSNAGTSVGSWVTPPAEGLLVKGETKLNGDLTQDFDNFGMVKYMVHVDCAGTNSSMIKFNNRTGDGQSISVLPVAGTTAGECYVVFPESLAQRYWQVSSVKSISAGSASCYYDVASIAADTLVCFHDDSGSNQPAEIMIMVY